MKLGKLGKVMKMAGKNLTELAYCVYLQGRNEVHASEDEKSYKEFCRDIKQVHMAGKELWQKNRLQKR